MPQFTYHGDDRYYPALGIEAVDGESHDLDEDPGDGRWTTVTTPTTPAPAVTAPPVQAPQTPAAPEPVKE